MACSGCAARREWIKKMARLAYERTIGKRTSKSPKGSDSGDNSIS